MPNTTTSRVHIASDGRILKCTAASPASCAYSAADHYSSVAEAEEAISLQEQAKEDLAELTRVSSLIEKPASSLPDYRYLPGTLLDIQHTAEANVVFNEEEGPDGYFTVSTKYLGMVTTYLIKGDPADPKNATIRGRVEWGDIQHPMRSVYSGRRMKGGQLLGNSDFIQANDDKWQAIVNKRDKIDLAPITEESEARPNGIYSYLGEDDRKAVEVEPLTDSAFKAAILNPRGNKDGTIRVVAKNPYRRSNRPTPDFVVRGPEDGRPILVDYGNEYPSNLKVQSGSAVLRFNSLMGGGVDVESGAAATIILPAGKFSVRAEPGSRVRVVPRMGSKGTVWAQTGAEVEFYNPDNIQHEMRIHFSQSR